MFMLLWTSARPSSPKLLVMCGRPQQSCTQEILEEMFCGFNSSNSLDNDRCTRQTRSSAVLSTPVHKEEALTQRQVTGTLAGRPTHHHLCAGPRLGDVTPEHQSDRGAPAHGEHPDACVLGRFSRAVILGCVWIAARCRRTRRPCWSCKGPISWPSTIRVSAGPVTVEGTEHQGFLQDKELPSPSPRKAKKLHQETRRVDKWIKMLKRWDHYLPSEKLRCRVYKRVPPQVRGQVWLRLLNIDQVKARNAGKYQGLPAGNEGGGPGLLPGHHADRPGHQPDVPQSQHVLGPLRGQEEGYCQGTSEIAAIVLMFLPEEDAFWALAQLMTDDRHAMHGFFVPGFQKLLRFQAHHERILERALPDLRKHMDEEQMSTGIYTPKWFLQCFLGRTPFSLTLKLWDAYILDGVRVLTAMAYTILKVHRKRLLKLPLEGLREFLQDSLAQPWALEDEAVLRRLRASMTQLRRMRCDLPPPAGPEEFPTRPLGLERVSPVSGPLLSSPASETPLRVEEPASPGPATQPEPPGPPPGQAIVQHPPQRWNSLPILHPPSATRRCRQVAPRHGGLEVKKRGPLPFGTCLGHPRGPATDQALEHPRDSHHGVPPAPEGQRCRAQDTLPAPWPLRLVPLAGQ
ncbi:USP6 N-terminal-like protein isoform 4-T4 [Lycaon pictus]